MSSKTFMNQAETSWRLKTYLNQAGTFCRLTTYLNQAGALCRLKPYLNQAGTSCGLKTYIGESGTSWRLKTASCSCFHTSIIKLNTNKRVIGRLSSKCIFPCLYDFICQFLQQA